MNATQLNEIIRIHVVLYRSYLADARRAAKVHGESSPAADRCRGRAAGIASVLQDLTGERTSYPALLHQFTTSSLLARPAAA